MTSNINREELARTAGFYNGEGSVYLQKKVNKNGTYLHPVFQIPQSGAEETDCLIQAQQALGFGNLKGPYGPYGDKKVQWVYRIAGFEGVQAALAMLWPWLSLYKKVQAKKVLSDFLNQNTVQHPNKRRSINRG